MSRPRRNHNRGHQSTYRDCGPSVQNIDKTFWALICNKFANSSIKTHFLDVRQGESFSPLLSRYQAIRITYVIGYSLRPEAKSRLIAHPVRCGPCEICRRILQLLTMPSALRGDTRYHLELGSPTQILSDKCRDHPKLISRCLDVDLQSCQLDSISILGFDNEDHLQIFAKKGEDYSFRASGELKLLPTPHSTPTICSPFVNTKWIDHSLPRKWKRRCDIEHVCTSPESLSHVKGGLPLWVVDTWQQCLVPCSPSTPYVALSYVWGGTPTFMALKDNLKRLQKPSSLAERNAKTIPKTVRDAMFFAQRLGERYLWVDMLCIVQDDVQKLAEIANMGAIYAQASITIIAADGDTANDGLRGLQGMSGPRSVKQFVHSLGHGRLLIETYGPRAGVVRSTWQTRGWTFQEALFSRRMVMFEQGWIRWVCHGAIWDEYGETEGRGPRIFSKLVPNVQELALIVNNFSSKNFTFAEDSLSAFSGIGSALSSTFHGGFVSGLPVSFFYIGLLWIPGSTVSRINPKRSVGKPCIPSWSWAGWKGYMFCRWDQLLNYVKKCSTRGTRISNERVTPLVNWSWTETLGGTKNLIEDTSHEYMEAYWNKLHTPCPPGWTRHSIKDPSNVPSWQTANQPQPWALPLCFYKHQSEPNSEFWYPLPMPQKEEPVRAHVLARYITCQTRICRLISGEEFTHRLRKRLHMVSIRDREGKWVGILQPCEPLDHGKGENASEAIGGIILELVEIAQGSIRNDAHELDDPLCELEEWALDERPKAGVLYEYYYVLWIEWADGVANRKGLGRAPGKIRTENGLTCYSSSNSQPLTTSTTVKLLVAISPEEET
ncbi:HET-domain-containing protein [Xylaria scruposa]|nr:HET-domain-containing protein [Xylaria scruposa]